MKKNLLLSLLFSSILGNLSGEVLAMDPPPGEVHHAPKIFFQEFSALSSDEIKNNHQRLKNSVNRCYANVEKHFNKSRLRPNHRESFDIKKGANLCAVGVQWIITAENKQYITPFEILMDSNEKELIASNTSSYQWHSTVLKEQKFHLLAWPKTAKEKFYTFDLMKKNVSFPKTFEKIYELNFKATYPKSFFLINDFIQNSFETIKNIVSKRIECSSLSEAEINCIKNLENFFINQQLLDNTKVPTNYFMKNSSEKFNIINLLNNYSADKLKNEDVDITSFLKIEIVNEEFLMGSDSELARCSYFLDVDNKKYISFNDDNNIISNTRKYYPLDKKDTIDIDHSEPLFTWWIDRNIENRKNDIISKFRETTSLNDLQSIFPIFFFYTERQTCPSCENIVQKMSSGEYVPILCFNNEHSPDFFLLSGSKFPVGKKEFTPSYSTPPLKYNLPFLLLKKLLDVKEPTDLHSEPFQANHVEMLKDGLSFMKEIQGNYKTKIQSMEENFTHLKRAQENFGAVIKEIPKGNEAEDPQRKAFEANNTFQSVMLKLMETQIQAEKKLATDVEKFFKVQEETLKYDEHILTNFKKDFQRIPIQYKIDL